VAGHAVACPTQSDVTNGVRVTFDDGKYSIITRDASGAVSETEVIDGEAVTYESANGILETGYVEDGTRDTFTDDFETSGILPLEPWSRESGTQILTDESGAVVERVGFSYHTLGQSSYAIGECTYDAIRVLTYYQFEDGQSMVELTFLTDLGFPINTGYSADGVTDVYRAVSITAE
jgi:hypothetical protein